VTQLKIVLLLKIVTVSLTLLLALVAELLQLRDQTPLTTGVVILMVLGAECHLLLLPWLGLDLLMAGVSGEVEIDKGALSLIVLVILQS
jgi:hypothetical protein